MATRLPGIFVAGDAANYPSKLHLIAGAISDAALAINSAKLFLDPTAPKTAQMSSNSTRFTERNKALGL
ncbi:hypothetical protein [Paenibacillus mendelii]|uniref:FAD/NAD(P)-binding domain-containing protein n=1 Tax=Paenibacillus mendelii TaxID=206163 RepID=A0ABV6J2A5_9BACL|nr:hypothetical protein [Paenibacillus mendelii]MCQ6560513.1 hypothetical protein [Paenibacillus mendelii]